MVDPFRRGGFGSPNLTGPFQTGGGNFGQYLIGDSGDDIAYLDKLRAQTAWGNGQLTDEAYLAALRAYVNSTEANTTRRVSAENELRDATISIGRAKIVRSINNATTTGGKIRELLRLARYDRGQLKDMDKGNEQYREQQDRISSTMEQVRSLRWSRVDEAYSNGQLTTDEAIKQAQKMVASTQGKGDNKNYRSILRALQDRKLGESLTEATAEWTENPTAGNAKAADKLMAKMIERYKPGSPQHKDAVAQRESFNQRVETYNKQLEDLRNKSKYDSGAITGRERMDYLRKRMGEEEPGSPEYIRKRDDFLNFSANETQKNILRGIEDGTNTPGDMIDFFQSQMLFMDPMSDQYLQMQSAIQDWQAQGYEALGIAQPGNYGSAAYPSGGYGGGHLVYPGDLAPGGRPVNKQGFASQYDGSAFANTNCGMASTAMLAWAVSGGEVKVSGGDMRAYSGDREGGTWTDDMTTALDGVGIKGRAHHRLSLGEFRKKIANGKPAVLTGNTANLPNELRIGSYMGGHGVYVDRTKEKNGKTWYFVMDPLGRAGYRGQWWDEESLYSFGWKNGGAGTPGSAVFAGKAGNRKKKLRKDESPPPQSFDTDYNGDSTVGRGGGTSREEAGPQRDWSDGKPTSRARTDKLEGTSPETVNGLLAAIGKIEERTRENARGEGVPLAELGTADDMDDARYNRVVELLDANGGDPRKAMVEWFTGVRPSNDVGEWSQTERWYANAAAKRMGLEKVNKDTVLLQGAPDNPVLTPATIAKGAPGAPTIEDATAQLLPEGTPPELGLNPTTDDLARMLLERLGIPPRANAVRMVSAWIVHENGNETVEGYNPLNLRTMSPNQLPGQIGITERGTANFDTLNEGLDATADVLERKADGVLAAIISNDPEAFGEALSDSGWSEDPRYANGVTQAWNTLPGAERVISNTLPVNFEKPVGLATATTATPTLSELTDMDPMDPHQMAWFEGNVGRAEEAAMNGDSTWVYEDPDGTEHSVPVTGGVVKDVLYLNYEMERQVNQTGGDNGYERDKVAFQRFMNVSGELDYAAAKQFVDGAWQTYDQALLSGDLGLAYEIENDIARTVNIFMGNAADADPIVDAAPSSWLRANPEAEKWARDTIDRVTPYNVDATRPELRNERGSDLGALVESKGLIPYTDPDTGRITMRGDPNQFFITIGDNGEVVMRTALKEPDLFAPATVMAVDPATGEATRTTAPTYAAPGSGYQTITFSNGMTAYVEVKPMDPDDPLQFSLYHREYESASKQIERVYNPLSSFNYVDHGAAPAEPEKDLGQQIFEALGNWGASLNPGTMMGGTGGGALGTAESKAVNEQLKSEIAEPTDYTSPTFYEREVPVKPDPNESQLVDVGSFQAGAPGMPVIYTFKTVDPSTGKMMTGWRIGAPDPANPQPEKWAIHVGDIYTGAPPGLIARNGKVTRDADGNPKFVPNNGDLEGVAWGDFFDFYAYDGTGATRVAGDIDGQGGPGQAMVLRESPASPDGRGSNINATLAPMELYKAGAIDYKELDRLLLSEQKAMRQMLNDGGYTDVNEMLEAMGQTTAELSVEDIGNSAVNQMLGIPPSGQLSGPAANRSMADPNVTTGTQAAASSAQVFLAEDFAQKQAQAEEMERQKVAMEAAAAAPSPQPGPSPKPQPTPGPSPSPSPQVKKDDAALPPPKVTYTPKTPPAAPTIENAVKYLPDG